MAQISEYRVKYFVERIGFNTLPFFVSEYAIGGHNLSHRYLQYCK